MKRFRTLMIAAVAAGAITVLAAPSTANAWGFTLRFGHGASDTGTTYCPPPYWDHHNRTYVTPPCERGPGYYGYRATPRYYYREYPRHGWGDWGWRSHERHDRNERHGGHDRHGHDGHRGHHD